MDPSQTVSLRAWHDASRIQKPEFTVDRMAALKARVAVAISTSRAKGGLSVGLHPALEDLGYLKNQARAKDNSKLEQKSQPDNVEPRLGARNGTDAQAVQDNPRSAKENPYFRSNTAAQTSARWNREPKQLIFNQNGKHIHQASAFRRQAALEAMKKRIAEQTRRAGFDEDLDVEKNFVVEKPPRIEWWDEGLVDGNDYVESRDMDNTKFYSPDNVVTEYIQHPIALEPPQDRHKLVVKPMFLTSKERAKLRRQRRMVELKEMQAKIRLGLTPAPPPKVKKGNLMRVLGEAAVKDPTQVEMRVNQEITERHNQHIQTNEEQQLTKGQKHDKLVRNQQKDAQKGIHVLVLKINSLANGQHRYKIAVNAEQLALTGTCIMHPKFNLVVVEGGAWGINKYKKLVLNRIDWTANTMPRCSDESRIMNREWLRAETTSGELRDLSLNKCRVVFEGDQTTRGFRKWGSKVCESDAEAREILARAKMENFWSLAKSLK